jgi:hypothetical protein
VLQTDQQIPMGAGWKNLLQGAQHLRQRFRVELGRSTRAGG